MSGIVTLAFIGTNLPAGTDSGTVIECKYNKRYGTGPLETELDRRKTVFGLLAFDAANANGNIYLTLQLKGNEYYESASSTEKVVTARRSNGVDEWLNATDHIRYLNGYMATVCLGRMITCLGPSGTNVLQSVAE